MIRTILVGAWLAGSALSAPAVAAATGGAPVPLHGRHILAIGGGLSNHGRVESSAGAGGTTARVSGFAGYVSYAYGVAPAWTVGICTGALDTEVLSEVTPGSVASSAASVNPILFGARWYPLSIAMGRTGRPYLGIGVGPYLGSATNSVVGTSVIQESVSETVIGVRTQAGIDWIVGQRWLIGLSGGYHAVPTYDQPIGRAKDYSGADFLVSLGVLFGRPR